MERKHRVRTWLITSALVAGTALGAAGVASAATDSSGTNDAPAPSSMPAPPQGAPMGAPPQGQDPFTMEHGPGEELLTGTIAEQVTAKALEAVPGATVIRVETDPHGGTYEAHMKQADGTAVTVTFNEDLSVKSTEDGFGPRPQGAPHGDRDGDRQGPPPAGAPQSPSGTQGAA